MRGHDDHGHGPVDERDGAVLQFAGGIAFGVDVADFLQFQRAFEGERDTSAPRPRKRTSRCLRRGRRRCRGSPRPRSSACAIWPRERAESGEVLGEFRRAHRPRSAAALSARMASTVELAGEGLGGGHADLGAREDGEREVGFARDGAFGHVDDGERHWPCACAVAEGGQRVGRLARLGDEDARASFGPIDGFAVAEFGGDIDVDREAAPAFEPVAGDQAGEEGGAAGDHHDAVEAARSRRSPSGIVMPPVSGDVVGDGAGDDGGLLVRSPWP